MDNPEAGSRPPTGTPGITGGEQLPPYGFPPRRPTNGLAIAALVIGAVSFVSCPLIGGVAVYLGNRARNEIRRTGEEGDSLALAGVIVGWCALGLGALVGLFAVAYFGFVAVLIGVSAGGAG
jgi:Domain of unknown function (DUF4190)